MTADTLEQIVEVQLLAYLKSLKVKTAKAKPAFSAQINSIKAAIAKLESEMDSYVKQIPQANSVLINLINAEVEKLNSEKMKLLQELNRLNVQENAPMYGGYDIDKVIAEWSTMDMTERKSVAKVFIKQITTTDDEIKVVFF